MHATFAATLHNIKLKLHDYLVQFEVGLVTGTILLLGYCKLNTQVWHPEQRQFGWTRNDLSPT